MANTDTPLMRQYLEVKNRHTDCLLFYRLGDFYELFFDDAKTASKILEITLTSRNKNDPNPVPMCGVPYHSVSSYIQRLVQAGYKVALCEQLEDASETKALVNRDVVRIISAGTQLDPDTLESKQLNLTHAAIQDFQNLEIIYWASVDYSTGYFVYGTFNSKLDWLNFFNTQNIVELLVPQSKNGEDFLFFVNQNALRRAVNQLTPEFYFNSKYSLDRIQDQFDIFSIEALDPNLKSPSGKNLNSICPIGALIKYYQETQKQNKIPSTHKLIKWGSDSRMDLDLSTISALELVPTKNSRNVQDSKDVSLLHWLDRTKTAMGGRLLRDWILRPLTLKSEIETRLDHIDPLLQNFASFQKVLNEIYDLERLTSRISYKSLANARDLKALAVSILKSKECLSLAQNIIANLSVTTQLKQAVSADIEYLSQTTSDILKDELPISTKEGQLFRKGFNTELDDLIELSENGDKWLCEYESNERKQTGIQSLKVRFNRVFGYYIEVTKTNLSLVPTHYIRKQTMSTGERYITQELKTFEDKILLSEKKRCDLEYEIFTEICEKFKNQSSTIAKVAAAVSELDVYCSFAEITCNENLSRPELVNEPTVLDISDGIHPTVSVALREQKNSRFIPNSIFLNSTHNFLLITGPNMGGKSTVMRQTALILLLAQIGCYVPAKKAKLGIADRIFTRIGANDNIAEGASTFMVEMNEMSFILRHATQRSLILVDEIGRGTSTYDGMSLAMALASDIATRIKARTLFSTHYHELTVLDQKISQIKNARMAVDITIDANTNKQTVHFLYQLESGSAERSYGILVARLAGLPEHVLKEAESFLKDLEFKNKKTNSPQKLKINQLELSLELSANSSYKTSDNFSLN